MRSPIAASPSSLPSPRPPRRPRPPTRRRRPATAAPPRPSTASPRRPRSTRCAAAATRPTPRSRRRPCSASSSRSPAASAAAASWSPTTPRQKRVTTLDHRERAPLAMTPESFFENGAPLAFNDARYSGLSVGVPGTVLGWERALKLPRHDHAGAGTRAGDPGRAQGFVVDAHARRPDPGQRRLVRRRARDGRAVPQSRRHAARRRQHHSQPRPRAHVPADRAPRRARASTAAPSRRRSCGPSARRR